MTGQATVMLPGTCGPSCAVNADMDLVDRGKLCRQVPRDQTDQARRHTGTDDQ